MIRFGGKLFLTRCKNPRNIIEIGDWAHKSNVHNLTNKILRDQDISGNLFHLGQNFGHDISGGRAGDVG